jgi:hypothetical protein
MVWMVKVSRLTDTIGRLQEHFEALHKARLEYNPALPVFALEHPLDPADVHTLMKDLRDTLRRDRAVVPDHALAWVVAASEAGYGFGGFEFWQSFDQRIPNWAEFGDRGALRAAFIQFCRQYHGAQPTGQWASHYTLICWPITHAILPLDLQLHLCQAIYVCRYQLAGLRDASAEHIGLVLEGTSPSYGTRFDEFLQEHALVGALVNRLLMGDSEHDPSFRPETFNRILNDLHRVSAAREWLREAGKLYNRRITIAVPREPNSSSHSNTSGVRRHLADLRPTITLEVDATGTWVPSLAPPSLMGWAQQNPEIGRILDSLRYRVLGTDRARQGACLLATAPMQTVLRTFPPLDQPLIELMPRHEALSAAFDADCRLPASRLLVFRENHGSATLLRKPELTSGETYLLATEDVTLMLGEPVACVDPMWQLRRLKLPSALTAPLSAQLTAAGLSVRRTTRVRPWGLVPRNWDEGNEGEWIVGEPIVFVIERDHAFDAINICTDEQSSNFVECDAMADPTIVLTDLSVGAHTLMVQTYERRASTSGTEWHELSRGESLIRVRTPAVWITGRIAPDALAIEAIPSRPMLDDLLKGDVVLTVDGVANEPVDISLEWLDGSATPAPSISILRQRAPIREGIWRQYLAATIRKIDASEIRLAAQRAFIRIACESLGEQRIALGVSARPVRWSVRKQRVHLICDGSHMPNVIMSSFAEPAAVTEVERRTCERGLELTQSGLYLATDGDFRGGVVLGSPNRSSVGLRAIGEPIHLHLLRACVTNDLIGAIERWEAAIPLNVYARTNQRRVINQMHDEVLRRIVGDRWMKLEAAHPRQWSDLEQAVDDPIPIHSFGYSLGHHRGRDHGSDITRRLFFEAAVAYAVAPQPVYLEVAWQLATRPGAMSASTAEMTDANALARLVRGARLIWLGTKQESTQ